jgi:trimeric autotransporter adhesin
MPSLRCGALLVLLLALSIQIGFAQSGIITTYVGPQLPVNGQLAVNMAIDSPKFVAPDGSGGFYVSSQNQNRVYRVDASGKISLVAGNGTLGYSGDGRAATSAQLNTPWGLAMDGAGNLYIADSFNRRIRKVTPAGIISTVAGTGTKAYGGDGGPATLSSLVNPVAIAVDSAGNLYIADYDNCRVRKVTTSGVISTIAGNGAAGSNGDGGLAASAQLNSPEALAFDAAGSLYIAENSGARIRKVTAAGVISTVAGTGTPGNNGDGGLATMAQLGYPGGVAVDSVGNIYIADYGNCVVRKVTPGGMISTLAGIGTNGYSGDGGPASVAKIGHPTGVSVDSAGNVYIPDINNNRVRKVTLDGLINTVAGNGTSGFSGDGSLATAAKLNSPHGIAMDSSGNLYIADQSNNRIRKVAPSGAINTIAGYGTAAYSGDGGTAIMAQLNSPGHVIIDSAGNLYIADGANWRVRKVAANGTISTIVGTGSPSFGGDGGPATAAQIRLIEGMVLDSAGNLYLADYGNHRIRKVNSGGIINTIAGNGTQGYSGDGGPALAAKLNYPAGLAVDSAGNLYIGDSGNNAVRKVAPNGIISTVAGNGTKGYSGDGGPATAASLNGVPALFGPIPQSQPRIGLTLDSANNLYIVDSGNNAIRKVTPDGIINTIAGFGVQGFSGDGGISAAAQMSFPTEVVIDPAGNLFITDKVNSRIRKVASILDCSSLPVSAGGIAACRTAGTSAAARSGYAKLTVNSGATPYGTGVFSLRQNGVTVSEAGVPVSPPTTRARIFIDYRAAVLAIPGRSNSGKIDINTGLSIVNQGSTTAGVEYALRGLSGELLAVGHGSITKGNHIACFINQLQQVAASDFNLPLNFQINTKFATLEIASDQPLSIVALRMTTNQREEALFTTTPVADMNQALTNTPIYFPQFADGGGYTMSLVLMNTSSQTETGTLQILDNNGAPMIVHQDEGITSDSFQYSIPAGGAYHFQSDGLSSAPSGWARILPDNSSMTPVGSGVFGYNPAGILVSESGIPSSAPTTHARVYVDRSGNHNVGIAIANVGSAAANITITSYQTDGVTNVGSNKGPLSLAPYGHDAEFADQLIEGLPTGYRGVLDISSTTPFAALTVRSLTNERGDFLMTTFPIADANQTAPTPVVFPHVADGGGYVTEFILISAGTAASTTPGFYNEAGAPADFSH